MVDATSAVLLNDSAAAIIAEFESAIASGTRPAATEDYGVPRLFEDAFEEEREVAKIPLLRTITAENLAQSHGKLVRCICYVVHSDSEIYGGAFRDQGRWQLGRYGLDASTTMPASDADLVFEERISLRCKTFSVDDDDNLERTLGDLSLQQNDATTPALSDDICVKLYNEKEEGLLHACLDVIGILEISETETTLHSIITKNQRLSTLVTSSAAAPAIENMSDVRADLVQTLEEALEGDALAAELVLFSLVAGVSMRSPILVGPLNLNLRNITPETAQRITKLIAQLAAHTFPFDMSIENLNKAKLYPSHDGEDFSAGSLQLPTDSVMLFNEAALSEGKLDERGVKNLQCIANTITTQDLIFHFPFSEFKIPVDLSIIVLSRGKSLLPSTISIALKRASTWNLNVKSSIAQMRHYLARCKLQEVKISEDVSAEVQEDFVKSRKQGQPMDQTDLSMALALGKEVTRSHGRRQMTWDDYQRARSLRKRIVDREVEGS